MSDPDFSFHWEGGRVPFGDLHVVRFSIEDAMSAPFEARLLLHSRDLAVDLDPCELVGKHATLRIATGGDPAFRAFHGLIVSAEDRGHTSVGALYEVVMMPPLARGMHRTRSRIFFEKTLRQIIEAVLLGDPRMRPGDHDGSAPDDLNAAFVVPDERFVWRVRDTSRLDDPTVRPHCVQYEESDFGFLGRLLEEEGIAYHLEHSTSRIVFVMSDCDDGRCRLDPFLPLSPDRVGRQLDGVRAGARLRPTKVKLVEYNWKKPKLDMSSEIEGNPSDLFVQSYPGRFHEHSNQGASLALARLERLQTEARGATASGSCRLLGAGSVFALEHPISRLEGEYLVTRATSSGEDPSQLPAACEVGSRNAPTFRVDVELARRGDCQTIEDSRYRPAHTTPKPRITGTQTATVVDEPGARGVEIHVGGPDGNENGCVRLKFHWDTEADRHEREPTSVWVRVSQMFAGAGGGAVSHPRVATEVIVSYEDGDPDRPIVTGRVYNGIQPSPALGKGAATVTTLKSIASPGGKVFNEFQFNDTAGKEQINLSAGKDWNSKVGNDRTESVTNDSTSNVGADRKEDTKGKRDTHVGATNTEHVDGDETVTVGGAQKIEVASDQSTTIGAARILNVAASNTVAVGASESRSIAADQSLSIAAAQTIHIGATKAETVGASYSLSVGTTISVDAGAAHTLHAPAVTTNAPVLTDNSASWTVNASGVAAINAGTLHGVAQGEALVQGALVTITAAGDVVISGGSVKIKGGSISLEGSSIKISGGSVDISGSVVKVN